MNKKFMTKISAITLIGALCLIAGCSKENVDPTCSTRATIRDLTGLDGCGFVFELEDGTRLEPIRVFYCGTEPFVAPTDDPLYSYEFVDGRKVKINYELADGGSICMVGPSVKITCLTEERRNDL
jgi:hypothetical protein